MMKNEKELYLAPEMTVIRFDREDVLATSGDFPGEWDAVSNEL